MSNNKVFTVADYLLTRLQQLGLDKVFQVPGDYVSHFMEALEAFDGIDAVGDVNELGAGYAADGYARYKGIGAVSVQYGVGTLSVINATAGSYVERNPVVVISASPSQSDREIIANTGALFHHSTGDLLADQKVFTAVTVASEVLDSVMTAPAKIDEALRLAMLHKRPIYLEAWSNVWGEPCVAPLDQLDLSGPTSNQDQLAHFVDNTYLKLQQAKQPVMILGIEIARLGLQADVMDLLSASGLPYTTTSLAKSVLDEEAGLPFIGTYADAASLEETNRYVSDSDVILSLGAIFTDDYLNLLTKQYNQMISVDMASSRIGNIAYHDVFLKDVIRGLTACFKKAQGMLTPQDLPTLDSYPWDDKVLNEPLSYEHFFTILNKHIHNHALHPKLNLILGESSSLYMAIRMNGFVQDSFICDAAWGSLGHETGCATGVSMVNDRRAMVVAGDGGFMMMCQALSTIARNKLNSVVFVMSNQVYAIEQSFVDICAFAPSGKFAPFDELASWNYEGLATAYGVGFFKVELGKALMDCLNEIHTHQGKAYLVEVIIPKQDLAPAVKNLADSINEKPYADCLCH